VAMGLSALVGTITRPYWWLHTLVLAPWCFGAGMLVALGQTQATVGTQAIIAFVVLGRFSASPLDALQLSLFVSTGALVEVAALLVLRLPPSFRFQRNRLSGAFEALAELARREPSLPSIDVAARLDEAERALAAPSGTLGVVRRSGPLPGPRLRRPGG
jgi:FUSC-like inner membrane protein yccS